MQVVVVPNNATAKKVPWIPGLLAYRKDQKKLYVRANKTWALLTQEKEVKNIYSTLIFFAHSFNLSPHRNK
jgi:hypothetical protein